MLATARRRGAAEHRREREPLPPGVNRRKSEPPTLDATVSAQSTTSSKESQATEIVRLASDGYTFHRANTADLFAVALSGPNLALPLRGVYGLRASLAEAFMAAHDRAPSQQALTDALAVVQAWCSRSAEEALELRVSRCGEGIVLDLGTPDGAAIVLSPDNWEVVEHSPITFRRTALTGALPRPTRGGTFDELRDLLNVDDASWDLLIGWLVTTLVPDIPYPVLLLRGEHGTAKTTAASFLCRIVDPSAVPTRSEPRDLDQWQVVASGSRVVPIDNLSHVPVWLSDAICRAATGEGLVKRRLYSDDDLIVLAYRRCVILTAIDPGALRGDLADRLLAIDLDRIPPNRRLLDSDLRGLFDRAHPRLLGALLDLAARVFAVLPQIKLDNPPRMADFARVLAAVDRVRGTYSLATYRETLRDTSRTVAEGDPVGQAVLQLAANHGAWTGSATDLYTLITPDRPPRGWPADAPRLSGLLKRLAPHLSRSGVTVDWLPGHHPRLVVIRAER
jgi:hypothetical protein